MFSIEANTKNVLNISANNHKKLLHITKNIIAKMNLNNELNNIDYFKLKISPLQKYLIDKINQLADIKGKNE